jgi:septal ring factor EnvC (AmiA/AmiB activator)
MALLEKLIIGGIVAAALSAGIIYTVRSYNAVQAENGQLKTQVKNLNTQLEQLNGVIKVYDTTIAEQNAAIEDWRKKGQDLTNRVAAVNRDLSALNKKYQGKVQSLLSAQVPATCPAAIGWSVDQAKELGAW